MKLEHFDVNADEEKYQEFERLLNNEIDKLKEKLIVIDINDILRIMGYDV